MQWLVRGASPNDSLFFHCKASFTYDIHTYILIPRSLSDSGHGGQSGDEEGDEGDGFDEGLLFLFFCFKKNDRLS